MESSTECLKRRMQLLAVDRLPEERSCLLNSFDSSYDSSNYRLSEYIIYSRILYARVI
jgi:hypothetical protein